MPKIKKEANSKKIPKNLFYYEIIGIILTIFSFFALARLGKFGFYLCLILKLLFGIYFFRNYRWFIFFTKTSETSYHFLIFFRLFINFYFFNRFITFLNAWLCDSV